MTRKRKNQADPLWIELIEDISERPIVSSGWYVPDDISLDKKKLIYRLQKGRRDPLIRYAAPGILKEFVQLADAKPNAILNYARHWGVLNICQHEYPATHHRSQGHLHQFPLSWTEPSYCSPLRLSPNNRRSLRDVLWEPLDVWRKFAQRAKAILTIAEELRTEGVAHPKHWQVVYGEYMNNPQLRPGTEEIIKSMRKKILWLRGNVERMKKSLLAIPWWPQDAELEHIQLAECLNEWLIAAGVRLVIHWDGKRYVVRLINNGLFGAIAIQLALVAARTQGFASCAHCGEFYIPSRWPRSGESNYCSKDICRKAGTNTRSRRRRHKQE